MKDIKFRGKISAGLENAGQWVYWDVRGTDLIDCIDPDTIGQSTGLHDKHGKEIWEGDIIKECTVGSVIWDGKGVIEECPIGVVKIAPTWTSLGNDKRGRVKLKDGSYSDLFLSKYDGIYEWPDDIEVIGNIYENPELVKIKGEAVAILKV